MFEAVCGFSKQALQARTVKYVSEYTSQVDPKWAYISDAAFRAIQKYCFLRPQKLDQLAKKLAKAWFGAYEDFVSETLGVKELPKEIKKLVLRKKKKSRSKSRSRSRR